MSWSSPLNVAIAILGISFLVIVHEGGHYLAARAFGMRVLRFSIGIGHTIWRYKPKGSPTTFQIGVLPLLAYVQIDGMHPTEEFDPNDPGLYANKSLFARMITIFAGPFANYLVASLMIFGLGVIGGYPDYVRLEPNEIGQVREGSPAAEAGLQPGDRILEAHGLPTPSIKHLLAINTARGAEPTVYRIQRGDEIFERTITPTLDRETGRPILGVSFGIQLTYTTVSVGEAAKKAIVAPWEMTVATFEAIGSMIERRSAAEVQSVVGMVDGLADSIKTAPQQYVAFLISISVALGLFNLLPIPALDGGRLSFLAYELVTRRRANERVEAAIHTVGLLFLLGVLVLVMAKDIMKFFT